MPDVTAVAVEAPRALDEGGADGVVMLANAYVRYLGAAGEDELWRVLDERHAVAFIHPADLPAKWRACRRSRPTPCSTPAPRTCWSHRSRSRYPSIRFVLSHAG